MFEPEKWIKDYSTLCDVSCLTSITLPSRMAFPISINNADNGNLINAIHGNFSSRESLFRPELDGETIKHVWTPRHITLSEISGLITAENCVQLGSFQDDGEFELLESLQTNGTPVSQVEKKEKKSQIVKKTCMAPKGSRCSRGPDHSTAQNMNTKELINSYRIPCPSGSKDRHSKVMTSRGPRDRRLRLSLETAIKFFNVQDRLGFDQPSRAVEWLIEKCQSSIDKLPEISTSESITNYCSQEELLMNSSASMTSAPKRSTSSKSTKMELHTKTREAKKPKTFTRRSGLGQRKSSPHRGEALSSYDTIAFGSSSQRVNEELEAIGRYPMNMEAHDLTSTLGGMQKQLHSNNNIFLDQRSQTSLDESTGNCNELNLGFNYNNAHLQSSPLIEAHYYPCQQKGSSVLLTGSFTGLNSTTFPVSSCPIPAQLLHSLTTDLQSTTTKF